MNLSIVTFSKIVSQIVFDVFRKLILEFWIQLEHFHESGNIDAFEITVGEGFDITAWLDNDIVTRSGYTGVGGFQMFRNVTSDEISFTWNLN